MTVAAGFHHAPDQEGSAMVEAGHDNVPFGYQLHNLKDLLWYSSGDCRGKGFLASAIALVIRREQFIEHLGVGGCDCGPEESVKAHASALC